MALDTRIVTEEGRKEIASDMYRTNLGMESLADVALKDSVTLSNVFEHANVVLKELDVEMLVASRNGESSVSLNNLDTVTAAQKQQAINDYTAAYAQVFGISIESALVIVVDKSMGGAHYMGQNGSNIVINDAAMKNAQAYMRTLAHEVTHGLTAQGAISDKGSSSLNEEYADLIGSYAEDNFAFALEHAGLGELKTGDVNSHIGNDTVLIQNNWNRIKDVPVSQLDFEIVRDGGYKKFSQLVQTEPRLNEMTLGQMNELLDNVTYLMTYGDGVANSPAAASEKMAYVIDKLAQQGIEPEAIQFLKDNTSRISDIIGPDNDQYDAFGRALVNVTTLGVADMIREPSTSERVRVIQEVWDNAFTVAGLPSAGVGFATLGADIAQLLGKKGIALLSKEEFIVTAKTWNVDVTKASKQEMDGLYQEYAQVSETLESKARGNLDSVSQGIPTGTVAKNVVKKGTVWKLKPTDRGNAIEAALAKTDYKDWFNVGKLNNGYFPLVDFQKGNTLVSLKSVDTAGSTWMRRMTSHIDDLATRGAVVNGQKANMVLDLRVQPGGTKEAASLVEYGKQQGIIVVVKEF